MNTTNKDIIIRIPLFSGLNPDDLLPVIKNCEVKSIKTGEVIYKYGEYGTDCGVVLSGSVCVELPQNQNATNSSNIKIILKTGDVFGEIAALSGYTRTAEVKALEPAKVLIIPKTTLIKLIDKFEPVKRILDNLYRERVLNHQLQSAPIFMGLPQDLLVEIINTATLHQFSAEEDIIHQDDEADAFYLLRYGFVKVTETGSDGKNKVLAYLKGGHYFGEMALMHEGGKRMATVTAMDRTEVIRISSSDFLHIMELHPKIRASLEKTMGKSKEKNIRIRQDEYLEKSISAIIDSGLVRSKDVLLIDFTKCIQCNSCINACSAVHGGHSRLVRKGIRLNNALLIATSCRRCDNPTCMIKCPTGAINRGAAGEIYYKEACIGCGMCARNCPYGNITMISTEHASKKAIKKGFFSRKKNKSSGNTENTQGNGKKPNRKRQPVKCDMCRDHSFMVCVYNCPTGAARRIDPEQFITDVIGTG